MNNYKNNLLFTQLATLLLIGLSIFVVYQMTHRSIWLDEALLLKSILNNKSFLDFINPLPYYNQAEPFTASLFFKFVTNSISDHFQIIRLSIALLLVIAITPLLSIFKKNMFGQLILMLVIFANLFTFGLYFTEIKHYAFEIFASCFMVYSIYLYDKTNKLIIAGLIISISVVIGFSTLIPAIIILGYILLVEYKRSKRLFRKDIVFVFGFSLLMIIITYVHMKVLTVPQVSNYGVYLSKGFIGDLKKLAIAAFSAYGKSFMFIASIATIYALFTNKKLFLFKLNIIFLVIILVVFIGKLTGVYPVVGGRHLVWLLPFSIVITTLAIVDSLKEGKSHKYVGYLLTIGLLIQSLNVGYKVYNKKLPEFAANNNLYKYVANMDKSTIVLFPLAQPSFEYYSKIMPNLKKHKYYGLWDSKTKQVDLLAEKGFSMLFSDTFSIPNREFYYLISHLGDINVINHTHYRAILLRKKFKEENCSYSSIFRDNGVQILKVICNSKGTNK